MTEKAKVLLSYPGGLFDEEGAPTWPWTCVRTRPRWEKRFSRWLVAHDLPHFLPLIEHSSRSHRKVHHTEVPLFPGYVFVRGLHGKQRFANSDCVVRLLLPAEGHEAHRLAEDILAIHTLLAAGTHPALLEKEWEPGQRVHILAGPLMGVTGQFLRKGDKGQLVVWVDLLGVGAAVNLDPDIPMEPADD